MTIVLMALRGVRDSRFYHEIVRLGEFIVEYVVSGELDNFTPELPINCRCVFALF